MDILEELRTLQVDKIRKQLALSEIEIEELLKILRRIQCPKILAFETTTMTELLQRF